MIRKTDIFKRSVAAALVLAVSIMSSGCSDYLRKVVKEKVTDEVTAQMDSFVSDPVSFLEEINVDEGYISALTDEQKEIALDVFSDYSYEIDSIKLNDKRTKATAIVVFRDVYTVSSDGLLVGTTEEIEDYIRSGEASDRSLSFTLKRDDERNWKIEDMKELEKAFFDGYSSFCVLDEEGNPININEAFVESVYVDSVWYDYLTGNPASNTLFTSVSVLQAVFYFNRPMSMTFEADLLKDGDVVDTREVTLNGDVSAMFDFESQGGGDFPAGSYEVELRYGDQIIASSATANVN